MQMLKNSGYDKGFRTEILRAGLKGYNKMLQDAKNEAAGKTLENVLV